MLKVWIEGRILHMSHLEQQDGMKTTSKGQKPVVTQAELQENTLQLESPQTKDTSVKRLILQLHKPKTLKKMMNQLKKIPVSSRKKLLIQILRLRKNNKIQIYLKIRHLECHKMIIIKLLSVMMSRTIQYSSAIQLHSPSFQEVSEYPLQR